MREAACENSVFFRCGCINAIDSEWGITHNISKCHSHRSAAGRSGLAYHESLGCLVNGVVQHSHHERELRECLDEMNVRLGGKEALEIGCGIGTYIPLLRAAGFAYRGVELDAVVASWVSSHFGVPVFAGGFETYADGEPRPDFIFAAHVFEHFANSPAMLRKAFAMLKGGGRIAIIVPDDQDQLNPDHLWFYNELTLSGALERVGFADVRMCIKRRIPQEKFIYATAVKP